MGWQAVARARSEAGLAVKRSYDMLRHQIVRLSIAGLLSALAACSGETSSLSTQNAESCMLCHNGSLENDYSGPGIENPHPFTGAAQILCTTCHGGHADGTDMLTSHVPPP